MAVVGFIFYGLLSYWGYSSLNEYREQTYDDFILQFEDGKIIATTFTNLASVCNWAHGILKYKNIDRKSARSARLLPTKLKDDKQLSYTDWCRIQN